MRQINNHMKEVMGIKKQSKPSPNPLKWNWVAIITWSVILTVVALLVNLIINIIF